MTDFHQQQMKWEHRKCTVCCEQWPARSRLQVNPETYVCNCCHRDKQEPKLFSAGNDMDPGVRPPCLEGLTPVEEMLLARACPIMSIYRNRGGQRGYRGHVLNLSQDLQHFLTSLPSNVKDLPILVLRRKGADNTHKDFVVRRDRVLEALLWLKEHNRFYTDIQIDYDVLQQLPVHDVPSEILEIHDECDSDEEDNEQTERFEDGSTTGRHTQSTDCVNPHVSKQCEQGAAELQHNHGSHSFLPAESRQQQEEQLIRAAINGTDPLDWPQIDGQPINEFQTPGLASMAFPTLFPYGAGDPTNPARHRVVDLTKAFKQLMRYADTSPDGCPRWRFASDPRFPYWALNLKQRHQLLSQTPPRTIYMLFSTKKPYWICHRLKLQWTTETQ